MYVLDEVCLARRRIGLLFAIILVNEFIEGINALLRRTLVCRKVIAVVVTLPAVSLCTCMQWQLTYRFLVRALLPWQ